MKKSFPIIILIMFLCVGFTSVDAKASLTIATFADPSKNSNNPLFTVDFIQYEAQRRMGLMPKPA